LLSFFNATPTPEIYTLSLHDALPIYLSIQFDNFRLRKRLISNRRPAPGPPGIYRKTRSWIRGRLLLPAAFGWRHLTPFFGLGTRSEEHTSELQSRENLVCRLLLEKKK